jgi:hypothetical protein
MCFISCPEHCLQKYFDYPVVTTMWSMLMFFRCGKIFHWKINKFQMFNNFFFSLVSSIPIQTMWRVDLFIQIVQTNSIRINVNRLLVPEKSWNCFFVEKEEEFRDEIFSQLRYFLISKISPRFNISFLI